MRRLRLQGWAALCFAGISFPSFADSLTNQFYADGRPRQLWYPPVPANVSAQDPEAIARAFLKERASQLGLTRGVTDLRLTSQQTSLLGTHFRFEQMIGSLPLDAASIVVTVLKDGRISQVFSSLQKASGLNLTDTTAIGVERAYDVVWQWLGVRGQLLEAPESHLVYVGTSPDIRLAYRLRVAVSEPLGAWIAYVDARTGKLISIRDERIPRKPTTSYRGEVPSSFSAIDRAAAMKAFALQPQTQSMEHLSAVSGQAQVFDPDPRTTLQRRDLEDDSPADQFAGAYFQRILPDISYDGSVYRLQGPWVRLADFEPPTAAPTTSVDGQWQFTRGVDGFTDAMSYFHIDQNQRYLQSLGYKDQTGLQFGPIEVDANGVNGDDNSHFIPSSNRIAYGHGCVDDNEDTDVILHEYFHAIQNAINPQAYGGDSGGMGEGSADYWAASYSLTTTGGEQFAPNEIYSWDGHGATDSCWPGRVLNASAVRYDATRSYPAHTAANNGFSSDELWSTPLFQSLLILRAQGIPREQVDTIVVEGQFGLGAAPTMRDAAQSVVAAATLLYPTGPHAEVFRLQFLKHGILEVPQAILQARISQVIDSGGDGVIDPGETLVFKVDVSNTGTATADQVQVELTSTDPLVTIGQGTSVTPAIPIGSEVQNSEPLSVAVAAEALCGVVIKLNLSVKAAGVEPKTIPVELRLGRGQIISYKVEPKIAIPDGTPTGVISVIPVPISGLVSDQLQIGVSIKHPYRGDLKVSLKSPSGKVVLLHNRQGFSADNIDGVYPTTLTPFEPLNKLLGENLEGNWELSVQDIAPADKGTLMSWTFEDTRDFQCTP